MIGTPAFAMLILVLGALVAEGVTRLLVYLRSPRDIVYDQDLVYTIRPRGTLGGVTTNDVGCVGDDVNRPKDAEEKRVFLFGGSASCSSDYVEGISDVLTRLNPDYDVKVVSFGKPRYTSHSNLLDLTRNALHYDPDVIGFYLGINDSTYNVFRWLEGRPLSGFFDWRSAKRSVFLSVAKYHLIDKLFRARTTFTNTALRSTTKLRANVHAIIDVAQEHGIRVLFAPFVISYPTNDPVLLERIRSRESKMRCFWGSIESTAYAVRQHNQAIEDICRARGVQFAELDKRLFPADFDTFADICHMRPKFQRLLGNRIGEAIGKLGPASREVRPRLTGPR